jgi:Fe-S cluster assembly protein SufD
MEKVNNKENYIKHFQNFESSLNGEASSELHAKRRTALKVFNELDFPTTKNEEWKYTSIAPLLNHNFIPASGLKSGKVDTSIIEKFKIKGLQCCVVVLYNGVYSAELSDISSLPANVKVESLSDVIKNNPEFILEHLGEYVKFENGFIALNTAFTNDGIVINVPDKTILEAPIHILNITGDNENEILAQPRNLIVTGKNCELTIIESYHSCSDNANFTNVVTEIAAGENSHVDLYRIQVENEKSFNISRTQVEQKRSSVITVYTVTTGGALVRNDFHTVLDDENCNCNLYGLYLIDGTQHVDNHTLIDHAKPRCLSNELYKGVINDKAHAVFNGKVFVKKDAQKTNAYQSNKNILLSKEATVDTKPQLEIFADDVKCSHGATVGQLDEESLFYLRSRGIPKDSARSILIRAFANDIFDEINNDALHEYFNELVFEKLR